MGGGKKSKDIDKHRGRSKLIISVENLFQIYSRRASMTLAVLIKLQTKLTHKYRCKHSEENITKPYLVY